jgi:hypothetical protein
MFMKLMKVALGSEFIRGCPGSNLLFLVNGSCDFWQRIYATKMASEKSRH